MNFSGKVLAITGAAVGIGRACAVNFAKHGAKLVLLDMNEEKLLKVKEEVKPYTEECLTLICDVSDEANVKETFRVAREKFGRVDILINNAAIWRLFGTFMETEVEKWKKSMDVNVYGTVYCTREVLPAMLEAGFGRIINIASVAGVYGLANNVHYSATKGAVIAMTRSLAKEVADKGITVNAVSPGSVSPSENDDLTATQPSELAFMGRTGSPMENAELVCFLASDEAAYISGQNIQIDGCRRKQ
jgi:NAD(P)-dependent dehydrogenase (short-subunit alcohol dehydrogenase family)